MNDRAATPAPDFDAFMQAKPKTAADTLPTPGQAVQNATDRAQALVDQYAPPAVPVGAEKTGLPPYPAAPLPRNAWTGEDLAGHYADNPRGGFQNPRTGAVSHYRLERGPLDAPMVGGGQMAEGVEQMAEPGMRSKAGGAAQTIEGALTAAQPLMVGAAAANPIVAARAVVTAMLAQKGTQAALREAGVPEEYARLAGDTAGVAAAGWTVKDLVNAGKAAMAPFKPGARFGSPLEGEVIPPEAQPQPTAALPPVREPIDVKAEASDFDQFMQAKGEPQAGQPEAFDRFMAEKEAPAPGPVQQNAVRDVAPTPGVEASAAKQAEPAWPSEPGDVAQIPTDQIKVDAPQFQFKSNVGQGGVGDEFKQVTKFDPEKSGILSVWKDPADGETYVVNGHHRLELGQRTGEPDVTARYLNAADATEARTKGALINIAEGRGDAVDAAKVFRDSGLDEAALQREGVSLKGQKAQQGLALANLDPHLFSQVVSGELPVERAAVIGAGVQSPEDQRALVDLLNQREQNGKRLTNDQVGEMIRLTNAAPKQTETQENLFGSQEMTRSLIPEKSEVSDYVQRRMLQEQRLFKAVGNEGAATRLGESGNVIKAGENAQVASSMGQAQALYQKLSTTAGPVNDALDVAAAGLATGEDSAKVKERAYGQIKQELLGQAARLTGTGQGTVERPQGDGGGGTGEAGGGELDRQQQPGVSGQRPGAGAGAELTGPHGPIFRQFHNTEKSPADGLARKPTLPRELAAAEPRYGYGPKQFTVAFDSDLDKAAYITAQKTRSKRDAAYLQFVMDHTGLSEAHARTAGYQIRNELKAQAKDAEHGAELRVPSTIKATETPRSRSKYTPAQRELLKARGIDPDARGGERGAVNLEDLDRYATEKLGLAEPRLNYSGLTGTLGTERFPGSAKFGTGKFKDKFIRNLSQLEEASPAAHEAAVRLAASNAQASAMIHAAVPQIERALGPEGPKWADLRKAYMESRLQGIRQRWGNFAAQASAASPAELEQKLEGGWMDLLRDIEEKGDVPQDAAQTATALRANAETGKGGKWDALRDFLKRTFEQARDSTAHVMTPDEFDAVRYHPNFAAADRAYGRLIEKPLNESHARNEGVFSDALGPLNRYYPLVPIEKAQLAQQTIGMNRPYKKPENFANQFATGLGEYDTSMKGLRERVVLSFRANNKAAFLQTLEDEGLFHRFESNERRPDTMVVNGVPFKAVPVETRGGRETVKGGKNEYLPAEGGIMPQWLQREVDPILKAKDLTEPGMIKRALAVVNRIALSGPTELVMHSYSLVGSLQVATPFAGKDALSKLGAIPLAGKFAAMMQVIGTDTTSAESAADIEEMAKGGWIPPAYGAETFSRKVAESTGAELSRTSFSPLLYGPQGIDVRTRLALYRLAKAAYPEATPAEMYKFGTWLPNYTTALQSTIERAVKGTGIAPFFTAGSTGVKNGIHSLLGSGPLPGGGTGARIAQWLTRGAGGLVLAWAIVHKLYRGEWPWEDKKGKLLQIRAKPEDRRSKLGAQLWGHGPEDGFINFAFFNPMVGRGVRALGVDGAYNTWRAGGNAGQIRESAMAGALNSASHPVMGPGARALFAGVTGDEAYVTGLRDRNAKPGMTFLPASKEVDAAPHVGAAVRQMNSLYANIGSATGFGKLDPEYEVKGDRWLKMVTDLAVPQLVGAAANAKARTDFLKAQRAAERRIAAKRRSEADRKAGSR